MTDHQNFWDITKPDPLVVQAAYIAKAGNVLDVGAGAGRDAIFLAAQGFSVTALDSDALALEEVKRNAQNTGLEIATIAQDIKELSVTGSFTIIVCDMVLHFLSSKDEVAAIINKLQELTAPSGVNVITAYTNKNKPGKRPYLFAENELKKYYSGWNIEIYEEKPTPWFHLPNETAPRRNEAVYLLAIKQD